MATGNQSVPGATVTAGHATAGRPITDGQANWADSAVEGIPAGLVTAELKSSAGYSSVPGAVQASHAPHGEASPGRAPRTLWRGAGGRWLVWAFRAVLWAVLLLIGYRGVAAIVTGTPVIGWTAASSASERGHVFPVALAKAYAFEFGQAYLNFNPATAAHRAATLAGFLPPGTTPQFGWNGAGAQTLQSEQVAGVRVLSPHRAVVRLLARVDGHLFELGVPIYAGAGGLVVSGQPSLLPPPLQVVPPHLAGGRADLAAKQSLAKMLPGFFRAYASGNALQLSRFAVHRVPLTGLGGVVTFGGIRRLSLVAVAGPARRIIVTITWLTSSVRPTSPVSSSTSPSARPSVSPSAQPSASSSARPPAVDMTYAMTVVRHGPTWLVRWLGPAVAQPWPSP